MKVIRLIWFYGQNKIILTLASVIFISITVFFACYEFENSNLNIMVEYSPNADANMEIQLADERANLFKEKYSSGSRFLIDKVQAKYGEGYVMTLESTDAVIRKIVVKRNELEIKKINIKNVGEYFLENTSENGKKNYMSRDSWITLIKNSSASLKEERTMAAAAAGSIYLILWIVVCMFTYRHSENFQQYIRRSSTLVGNMIRFIQDVKQYSYYIIYSAKIDLKAEVANSYLNWFWWILEPFCNMLVYVIVFGQVLGSSIENYAVFIFSGLLMWNFFNKTILNSVKTIRSNRDIVTKVYIPKFVLILSNMFLNLFKLLFSLIVLFGLMVFFHVKVDWHLVFVPIAYIIMFVYAFGCSMILMHFGVFIDDLAYAVSILMQMLMFLSGIFYQLETGLPEPLNKIMLYCNPAAMLIDTVRNGLLYQTGPNIVLLIIWFFLSCLLCVVGIHVVYRNENSYVKVV